LRDPFAEFALLPGAPDPIPLADVTPPARDGGARRETGSSPRIRVESWPEPDRDATEYTATDPPAATEDEADEPLVYVVQPGDTLSGLAGRFLGSTRRFLNLYEANRHVLSSPDNLKVGMRLIIPGGTGDDVRAARTRDSVTASEALRGSEAASSNREEGASQSRFRPVDNPFSRRSDSNDIAP
jgi:LysM repeat protein